MSQERAPIVEMLSAYASREPMELCCPGHRQGRQTDEETLGLLGRGAYAHDVTQVPGIDDLLAPVGAIDAAQRLAASLWGARQTHFLVNGTTSGIQAAFLAVCREGDRVAVPRACHRSVVEGLILSGALPIWVSCPIDPIFGCAVPPDPDALERAAADAIMVVSTRPTYHGDVAVLPWSSQRPPQGAIRLVDEAWGAHLGLHPEQPHGACTLGADLVVNSTHKTCGALSGSSMLHRCTDRVDEARLSAAVRLLTTTSPYYPMLASLDGARRWRALHGRRSVGAALDASRQARAALAAIEGVDVADGTRAERFSGVAAFDETRLVFSAARLGWSGRAMAAALRRHVGLEVELADARALIAQVSGEVDAARLIRVTDAVRTIVSSESPSEGPFTGGLPSIAPEIALSPREAYLARHVRVPLEQAVGRVAAEMVCPYPPGMAVVSYGERITPQVVETLRGLQVSSLRLQGCADLTLETVQVVA